MGFAKRGLVDISCFQLVGGDMFGIRERRKLARVVLSTTGLVGEWQDPRHAVGLGSSGVYLFVDDAGDRRDCEMCSWVRAKLPQIERADFEIWEHDDEGEHGEEVHLDCGFPRLDDGI